MHSSKIKYYFIQIIISLLIFVNAILSQSNSNNNKAQPINFGFSIKLFSEVDIRDAEVAIQMWGNEFFGDLEINYYPQTKFYYHDNEFIDAIKKNKLDFMSLSTPDYFKIKNHVKIEPYLMITGNEKYGYNFILLVRKDKNIKSIYDLKNRQINVPSGEFGELVKMWLEVILHENENKSLKYFSEIREFKKPSQALLPVFFKQNDACVISERSYVAMLELNPQLKNELVIIEKSPELVGAIMCINTNLSKNIKEITLDTAKKLSQTASGKQILALFKANELVKYQPEYLESTKELIDRYEEVQKQ